MLGAMINNMKSYGTKDAARKFNLFSGVSFLLIREFSKFFQGSFKRT